MLSKIINNDLSKMDKYVHSNTGMYVLEYDKGYLQLLIGI